MQSEEETEKATADFDELAAEIRSIPGWGVLLLEEGPGHATEEKALNLLRRFGVTAQDVKRLRTQPPVILRIRITPESLAEAALLLGENGFTRFKAVAPRNAGPKT